MDENALMQLQKITDSKTGEDGMRPYRYRRRNRRPCPKCPSCPECKDCPYNFTPPACENAEPQTPRDLSTGMDGNIAEGFLEPKAIVLNKDQAEKLPLVNVHWHLGGEHKSDAYNNGTDSENYDDGAREFSVRPGWMCPTAELSSGQLENNYTFDSCAADGSVSTADIRVGKSYEIHYVRSTAGVDANLSDDKNIDNLGDGLGSAANGRNQLNPMLVVRALIVHIVNGAQDIDLFHGWELVDHGNSVIYSGSTTGTKVDNTFCSPYIVTWQVNRNCIQVSPESFNNLCKKLSDLGEKGDLAPQGSRILVNSSFVVPSSYVFYYDNLTSLHPTM